MRRGADLSKLIDSQQQLGAQFTENENVKKVRIFCRHSAGQLACATC